MSWQGYIDNLKTPENNVPVVEEAAICGEDGSVWAKSPGMTIEPDEIKRLVGNRDDFGACGLKLAGVKCRMLRDNLDDDALHSMDLRTAADTSGATYSVCVGKTTKAFVIAKGCKDANGGQVSKKVANVVDYLRKLNY